MAGNRNIVLQKRDHHLLEEAAMMRLFDRDQAMLAGGFGSVTRANTRLQALTQAGYFRRFFLGSGGGRKAIYALSPKGARTAQVQYRGPQRPEGALVVADNFVQHQLSINDIYCALKYLPVSKPDVSFRRWLFFGRPVVPGIPLIPDGYAEFTTASGVEACFLEVDLGHEALKIWHAKAKNYGALAVSEDFRERSGIEQFRVLVLVNSPRRLESIRSAVADVTEKIFWFATLESIKERFFDSVWSRPRGATTTSLFDITL